MLSEGEVDLSQVNGGNINCIHMQRMEIIEYTKLRANRANIIYVSSKYQSAY